VINHPVAWFSESQCRIRKTTIYRYLS